jgi:hypothetical protein
MTDLILESVCMTRTDLGHTGRMIATTSDTGQNIRPVNLLAAKALITTRLAVIHPRGIQEADTKTEMTHNAAVSNNHNTKDRIQEEIVTITTGRNSMAMETENAMRGIMGTAMTGTVAGHGIIHIGVNHPFTRMCSRNQIYQRTDGTQPSRLRPRPSVIDLAGILMPTSPTKASAKMNPNSEGSADLRKGDGPHTTTV